MALKSFKNESMYSLQMYTQYIETQSSELMQFLTQCKNALQENKIGITYYNSVLDQVRNQVDSNNEILEDLEKELVSRIRKKFPTLMSAKKLSILGGSFEKEMKEFAALSPEEKEENVEKAKVVRMKFGDNVSKEKEI